MPKSALSGLGKAIIRDRFQHKQHKSSGEFTRENNIENKPAPNLVSVTEENTLNEFLNIAELASTQFYAEHPVELVTDENCLPSEEELLKIKGLHTEYKGILKIPRRPKWNESTTAEELDNAEKKSFLEWRSALAHLSEIQGIVLTPYEKNLEFWRQLWRVIERSDIVVQIVDARNPLLFLCEDLESYVKEVSNDHISLVLVNKADFLNQSQRTYWAEYFKKNNIKAIFWSATREIEKFKSLSKDGELIDEEDVSMDIKETDVLTTSQLLFKFRMLGADIKNNIKNNQDLVTVGFIGYPNVGKSSTLNALLCKKINYNEIQEKSKKYQVSVSATPGKTKHFQTFYIDKSLVLCDCPGLVMPMFVSSKAEMITNGILSIDHMTDFIAPISIICKHIPVEIFESSYGIILSRPTKEDNDANMLLDFKHTTNTHELVNAYAKIRGFMTHKGIPDSQRAARLFLKDYVTGKLCYCHSPPDVTEEKFGSKPILASILKKAVSSKQQSEEINNNNNNNNEGSGLITDPSLPKPTINKLSFDDEYFTSVISLEPAKETNCISKNKTVLKIVDTFTKETIGDPIIKRAIGQVGMNVTKPESKKHNNVKKREKLRRIHDVQSCI